MSEQSYHRRTGRSGGCHGARRSTMKPRCRAGVSRRSPPSCGTGGDRRAHRCRLSAGVGVRRAALAACALMLAIVAAGQVRLQLDAAAITMPLGRWPCACARRPPLRPEAPPLARGSDEPDQQGGGSAKSSSGVDSAAAREWQDHPRR